MLDQDLIDDGRPRRRRRRAAHPGARGARPRRALPGGPLRRGGQAVHPRTTPASATPPASGATSSSPAASRIHTTIDLGLPGHGRGGHHRGPARPRHRAGGRARRRRPGHRLRAGHGRRARLLRDRRATAKYNLAMGKGRHTGSSFKPHRPRRRARGRHRRSTSRSRRRGRSSSPTTTRRGSGTSATTARAGPACRCRPAGGDGPLVQHRVRAADPARRGRPGHRDGPRHGHHPATSTRSRRPCSAPTTCRPLEMASVYATLANRGRARRPGVGHEHRARRRHDPLRGRAPPAAGDATPTSPTR